MNGGLEKVVELARLRDPKHKDLVGEEGARTARSSSGFDDGSSEMMKEAVMGT